MDLIAHNVGTKQRLRDRPAEPISASKRTLIGAVNRYPHAFIETRSLISGDHDHNGFTPIGSTDPELHSGASLTDIESKDFTTDGKFLALEHKRAVDQIPHE